MPWTIRIASSCWTEWPCSAACRTAVGYDITIIKEHKKLNSKTTIYDTGIILNVSFGYYIELVPRSSLSKSGYILSNSPGTIEKSYTGTILVSLTKVVDDAPDLILPFKCCQLKFVPQVYLDLIYEPNTNKEITNRGDGSFGSTEEKKTINSKKDEIIFDNINDVNVEELINKNIEETEKEIIFETTNVEELIDKNVKEIEE